ncbi:ABC transporter substrate-binding protein [Paeniglutamicibacter psychrophenolicus]|uniref:NitT/TauT family transport system substrate-binding protein n=1 Tax=Paeniglutamicibacter psychrophenolicus TaxID=257454 RepID=A0ABS4WJX0_9MICC|nr:ABC transporter substrate-binding protein [Paeniglutamicibacter psychrophenolicus]MBP2376500.1 NitT/TauT family transport system substrate-binding protein [Paeniglutamicibacter psychrophenolicus]
MIKLDTFQPIKPIDNRNGTTLSIKRSRRGIAAGLTVALAVISLTACGGSSLGGTANGDGSDKLTVGSIANNAVALPLLIAVEQGFFEDAGLEVEVVNAKSGPEVTAGLIGGTFQIGFANPPTAMPAMKQGQDLVALPPFEDLDWKIVATSASGITDLKSLKGKKLGVTARGSATESFAREVLKDGGVDPDSVTYIAAGLSQTQAPALRSGAFDATVLPYSSGAVISAQGIELTTLADSLNGTAGDIGKSGLAGFWMTTRSTMEKDAKAVKGFCQAMAASTKWLASDANKAAGTALIADFLKVSPDVASITWDAVQPTFHDQIDASQWSKNAEWVLGSDDGLSFENNVSTTCS